MFDGFENCGSAAHSGAARPGSVLKPATVSSGFCWALGAAKMQRKRTATAKTRGVRIEWEAYHHARDMNPLGITTWVWTAPLATDAFATIARHVAELGYDLVEV